MKKNTYAFRAKVWLYPGDMAAWHFITLPKKEGQMIKEKFKTATRGWGSLPVEVTVGTTTWKTSIFPDKTSGSYLLPLKAHVRKREEIEEGDTIAFTLQIYP